MYTATAIVSALTAFTGLVSAAPLVARDVNNFAAIASRSGDAEIHQRAINANGGRFFLGKDSSNYCPNVTAIDCTGFESTSTVFTYNPTYQTLFLDVTVPGGQQIYVAPTGELGYTTAHSAQMPANSGTGPFQFTPPVSEGSVGGLGFQNGGFLACPVEGDSVYQIYAQAYGNQTTYAAECTGFAFSTVEWTGATAWQY